MKSLRDLVLYLLLSIGISLVIEGSKDGVSLWFGTLIQIIGLFFLFAYTDMVKRITSADRAAETERLAKKLKDLARK